VTDVPVRESVFGKLVAVMVTMAVSLLLLVFGFFWLIVSPNVTHSIDRVLEQEARTIAAAAPDRESARRLAASVGFEVRYEGRGGGWATADDLPTVADVRERRVGRLSRAFRGRHYYRAPGPDGGAYLFAWDAPRAMLTAHVTLLIGLLLVMCAVVFTAHTVIERLLRPLRALNEGVAKVGDGELDVALPNRTRDEFGRLTDAFNQMVARVRAMIAARDQLLLDVSHELRSPVTRLKVALELLPDSDQRIGMAADLAEMEGVIADLLELERLRNGRGIEPVRQDLLPIVTEVAHGLCARTPGVRIVATPEPLPVDIDAERMRMVLRNLVENAIKYSLSDSRAVEVSAVPDHGRVIIRVTDDGPGIPQDDLVSLFEPFFRVDRSRSRKTGGYGLGLSISKRIVEAHGGTITVEPRVPRGASFVVTLPRPS
jgi:signal transduction histidine kinase